MSGPTAIDRLRCKGQPIRLGENWPAFLDAYRTQGLEPSVECYRILKKYREIREKIIPSPDRDFRAW
jgi:hypothetical protein